MQSVHLRKRISIFVFSFYFSEMCLEQALTIHALLQKKQCPVELTNPYPGRQKRKRTMLLLVIDFDVIRYNVKFSILVCSSIFC